MKVTLDLTPWIRGPKSGVGLTAFRSAQALRELNKTDRSFILECVRRDQRAEPHFETELGQPLKWLNPFRRWSGSADEIFHSVALQLPEVKHSVKVMTVHDCWTLWPNKWQDPKFQKSQSKKLIDGLKRAKRLITPTEAVRKKLAEWDPHLLAKTHVIHWGPLMEGLETSLPSVTTPAFELPVKVRDYFLENRPYVLVVATLEARKNHKLIFKAIRGLKDLDLVLAGAPGFGYEKVMESLGELPNDVRVEHFSDLDTSVLSALYDRSVALVSASFDEGFGLPIVEAMARGKPVLLSKIPAHEEIAGRAGIYFDPESGSGELREYLESLKMDPYVKRDLAERSRKRAADFSWERVAKQSLEVYRSAEG